MASMERHAEALKSVLADLYEDGYVLTDGRSGNVLYNIDISNPDPQYAEVVKSGEIAK